jgi:hypothetical protein
LTRLGIDAGKMTMGSGKHNLKKGKDWDSSIPDKIILKNFKEFQRSKSFGELL